MASGTEDHEGDAGGHESPSVDLTRELEGLGIRVGVLVAGIEIPVSTSEDAFYGELSIGLSSNSSPV